MDEDVAADVKAKGRPWLSTLLSVLVPGFGLVRAGRPLRGLAWFAAVHAIGIAATLLMIWRAVPTAVVVIAWVGSIAAYVTMWVDSWRPGRLRGALWILFIVAIPVSFTLGASRRLIAQAFRIPTGAMQPTLNAASASTAPDHFISDVLSYRFSPPRRGDLAVFRTDGIRGIPSPHVIYIKRVVGLPGERIAVREGNVFANERPLGPADGIPDSIEYFNGPLTSDSGVTVPEGSYFMLGDNSAHSYDSRYWGAVPRDNIFGRVARIYYPLSRAGVPR